MLIVICILLILPASSASDDVALNQSETLSADNDLALNAEYSIDTISERQNVVYVNSTYEKDDGTGSADNPVRSISEGLNLVSDDGTIYLESNCGELSNYTGLMTDGTFNTTVTLNDTSNPLITANVDGVTVKFDFTNKEHEETIKLIASCKEITEGEDAVISLSYSNINGICLVDIGSYKYYGQFVNGKANVTVPNLKRGKYEAFIRYLNDTSINATATITVAENPASESGNENMQIETRVIVNPNFNLPACDINAGESGGYVTFTLTDANGKAIANNTLQLALNGNVYNAMTNDNGI